MSSSARRVASGHRLGLYDRRDATRRASGLRGGSTTATVRPSAAHGGGSTSRFSPVPSPRQTSSGSRGARMQTIETEKGPIEIGLTGSGPPVLFVHGTPGGADSLPSSWRWPAWFADYEHRRAGVENDLNQVRRDRVARARADWSSHPGGGRRCRRRRAPEHSDYAAATIPGADKIVMKGGRPPRCSPTQMPPRCGRRSWPGSAERWCTRPGRSHRVRQPARRYRAA